MPIFCSICQLGKSCKLPFDLRNKIEKEPLLTIHCELGGPAPIESSKHMKYYVIFYDHTIYTWIYPLERKS